MSGNFVTDFSMGRDATDAFNRLVGFYRHLWGHHGESGSPAEWHDFSIAQVDGDVTPDRAEELAQDCAENRIHDDRAGCIEITSAKGLENADGLQRKRVFLFFGWARS